VKPVFLDSVGLIAMWNRSDQWHVRATDALDVLEAANRAYVSTPFVLAECGNAASRRGFRDNVVVIRRSLESSKSLIWPTDEDWTEAWAAYERGRPGDPGIVGASPSPSCVAGIDVFSMTNISPPLGSMHF
jgi:predicted nucleic acid-binding protein